jgi:PAS domain S-box-containing protein
LGHWELNQVSNTLYWSDEIYRIFNLKPQEFKASYEGFLDMVHPEDREFVDSTYNYSLKNKTPYDIVHRLLLKDGTIKYVYEKCKTEYGENDKPIRSIGIVQDITERKQLEESLKVRACQQEIIARLGHEALLCKDLTAFYKMRK